MQILALIGILLLQIFCVVHALRRGYPYSFVGIILFFPLIGPIAYLIIEIGPDIYYLHIRRNLRKFRKEDPYQELTRLQMQVRTTPTIENKHQLVKIYLQIGQYNEALYLLEHVLKGHFATDPFLLLDKAKALFAIDEFNDTKSVLDFLNLHNPQFQSPEAHLLHARTLSSLGDWEQASQEFERLESNFCGLEASYYYLLHLRKLNNQMRAQEVLHNMQRRLHRLPKHYHAGEKTWLMQAQQEK